MGGLFSIGTSRPFWVGTAIDKWVVFLIPAGYFLVSLPFMMWSMLQVSFAIGARIASNFQEWIILFAVWIFFFSIIVLWEPLFSIMIQIVAPLLVAYILFALALLNNALNAFYIYRDLFNVFVPILSMMINYVMQYIFVELRLISLAFSSMDIVSLIADLYDVAWFFVDIYIGLHLALFNVLPVALTIMVQIFSYITLLVFEAVDYLLPLLYWLFTELFVQLTPILGAVVKLVRIFSSLFRKRSDNSSSDSIYSGADAFLTELYTRGRQIQWDLHVQKLEMMQERSKARPHYTMNADPVRVELLKRNARYHTGDGYNSDSDNDDNDDTDGRGLFDSSINLPPLHTRFRDKKNPLYFHHANASLYHSDHSAILNRGFKLGKRSQSASQHPIFQAFVERRSRATKFAEIMTRSLHAGIDMIPPVHAQFELATRMSSHICKEQLGFKDCTHALNYYHTEINHPTLLLERIVPDVTQHPIGRFMLEKNPAENRDHRLWWHEWRRNPTPVSGFLNSREINTALFSNQTARSNHDGAGDKIETPLNTAGIPSTINLPFSSVADCFTTNPRNLLCLPNFPPRGWSFPVPRIESPVDIDRDCPPFIAPPDLTAEGRFSFFQYFNPWTILWNSLTWLRYFLGLFVTVVFEFKSFALRSRWLSWITKILIWSDPRKVPTTTKNVFCLIANLYWPLTLILFMYTFSIVVPPIWSAITQFWGYLIGPINMFTAWRGRLLNWYQEADPKLGYLRLQPPTNVADEFFVQPSVSDTANVSLSATPVTITKRAEDSAERFTKLVGGEIGAEHDTGKFNSLINEIISDRDSEFKPSDAVRIIGNMAVDNKLAKLEAEYRQLCTSVQHLINYCAKTGILHRCIEGEHQQDLLRLDLFKNTTPRHSYDMTAMYIQHVVHNTKMHFHGRPAHEFKKLPYPTFFHYSRQKSDKNKE